MWNPWEGDVFNDQHYLRCAPGRTNPLYPPGPEAEWGRAVRADYRRPPIRVGEPRPCPARPPRPGRDLGGERVEADGAVQASRPGGCRGKATERLEEFLAARIAGQGAELHVLVDARLRCSAPLRHHFRCPIRAIRDRACGRAGVALRRA